MPLLPCAFCPATKWWVLAVTLAVFPLPRVSVVAGGQAMAKVEPAAPQLRFPANPAPQDFLRVHVFEEPLVPIGGHPSTAENSALAEALVGYSKRSGPDDFASLTGFLQKHPQSTWAAALLTDLGLEYYNTAHYSLALDAWAKAWSLAKDATDAKGKAVGDRAAGELAYMYARLGRMTELEALLNSVEGRVFVGPATEKIVGAREGLWNMNNRPEISFRCGPLALQRILVANQRLLTSSPTNAMMEIFNSASTQKGFSLPQVAELSRNVGLNYQMTFRKPGGDFVVPSVVHWKVGHYAAMLRREGDRYLLEDPTFGNTVWATTQALEQETSGYFLIPSGPLLKGWRVVEHREGETIWGKGITTSNDPRDTGCDDPKTQTCSLAPCPDNGGGGFPGGGGGGGGNGWGGVPMNQNIDDSFMRRGMAVSSVHLMLVNLNLVDSPVGYSPPVGPSIEFTVRYSHRDAFQPGTFTYSNFGSKWTCDWISYITDNPQSLSADVNYYKRGGGTRTFTGFNTNTQTYTFQQFDQTQLTRTGPASYEMLWRDGSKLVFNQSDGSVGTSRKVFLSQVVDPFGNAVSLNYDGSLRLTAITDAIGQATALTYGNTNDIYKITQVTDPFGRFASFGYDSLNRLTNITDVIGITSRFTYETNGDFINALITPYGTNSFTRAEAGTTRVLETRYPDGSRDRVEYNQGISVASGDAAIVPLGMLASDGFPTARDTYYWSRNACAIGYGDYTKAKIYHWLHTADGASTSGILQTTKEALERRVWYDYPGQVLSFVVGSSSKPTHVGRVLDDGLTQLYTYAYDGFGHVTNSIDPVGRTFSYIYATNSIDLLEVRMTHAGKNELLSRMTYNSQHLPLTTVDAAGQTNSFTYNARGQLLTSTNPKGETTTNTYDPNGYLIAVDGPLPGTNDTVTATYDALGRVHTKTDVSGYTLTFEHDALDHLTKITHPDGTYAQIIYNRLDPVVVQDRAGRQTFLEYDAVRQMTKRTDPLGRVTQFEWCSCGEIKSLTDPMGRTTAWQKDVQGRLVSKTYGDGSQKTYTYENTTSRLRQVVDEKLQSSSFAYNLDNTLKSIGYANTAIATPGVAYTYDPDYERIATMTDGTGTTVYQYNAITNPPAFGAGQLTSVDGPLPNDTITYGYDELGRRVSTAINGVASTATFDAAGRVGSETNALGSFSYAYDGSSGRILSETFPNGQTTSRSYGSLLQDLALQRITYQVGATPVSEFLYGRDIPASRITTWSQQAGVQPPSLYTFGYDAADQLLSGTVTNSGSLANTFGYAYDLTGNRLMEQAGGVTNTAAYNALNQISTTAGGAGASRINEWDGKDRLVAVNAGNQRTEFACDGMSRLASIRQLTNGTEVSLRRFVWCDNQICEERDASGAVTKRFFRQGVKLETGPNVGYYYYTRDHLGSIRELTDSSGNVRARYSYDPFGRRTKLAGDLDADFGFAGIFWTPEAALSLARFRAYDPQLGRWMSRDPLRKAEEKEGPNLYAYVGNNPVNRTDPLGLRAQECCEKEREFVGFQREFCQRSQRRAAKDCALALRVATDIAIEECLNELNRAAEFCDDIEEGARKSEHRYLLCVQRRLCDVYCEP